MARASSQNALLASLPKVFLTTALTIAAFGLLAADGRLRAQTPTTADANTYAFATNQGTIFVELRPDAAPKTVANFLTYVKSNAYNNSFFHRLVADFVLQGGGYSVNAQGQFVAIPANAPVANEFKLSNVRGTLAMALLGNDPNSATNQFFFNLADNSSNLDTQDGGFTVFGQIIGLPASPTGSSNPLDVIAQDPVVNDTSPFNDLPVQNYDGTDLSNSNLVYLQNVSQVMLNSVWIVNANGTLTQLTNAGVQNATAGASGTPSTAGAVAVDASGNVWSVNNNANALNEVSRSGTSISGTGFTGGGLNSPTALAIDGAGAVWVANQTSHTVSEFTSAGVAASPSAGFQAANLSAPTSVAVDTSGSVWLSNSGSNTVTKLLGAATPVAPPSVGALNSTLGTRP